MPQPGAWRLEDSEPLLRAAWEGHVPAVVSLAPDELTTLERPRELFLMLPRQGYLPYAATRAVYDHFGAHAPPCLDEVWFEFDGTPLRWNVPIGVLVDQCVGVDDGSSHPWRLTAHFSNFPSEILLRGGGVMDTAATAAHYINTLKESTYLRFGSTQPIMSLSTDAQRQLQRAVEFGRFDDYAAVRAQLLPHAPVTDERRRKVRLAIRLCQDDGPWIQPALSVLDEDGVKPRVLGDVLCAALPHANSEKVALIHGVPAPLNAPVDWLSAACAHPDGFLYVVVRSRIQPSANTS